jgi:hypothetical protein
MEKIVFLKLQEILITYTIPRIFRLELRKINILSFNRKEQMTQQ